MTHNRSSAANLPNYACLHYDR